MSKLAGYLALYTMMFSSLYIFNDGSSEEQTDYSLTETYIEQETVKSGSYPIGEEEICLIALVTMAEAEGESEKGQRLVIDTILNRVDSEYFPDTVKDVIWQPYQFSCMWNGRAKRCESTEYLCGLVCEELEERSDNTVIFFRGDCYGDYGVPMFKEGSHYFSSYN
ncbi:MAG: cell wall hydrolase [Ruminococcus sp.]|nr:cell wall hydrolase [Ruminococcus sp.]